MEIKRAPSKRSGVMPIPFMSTESPNLVIVNLWLITPQQMSIKYSHHRDHNVKIIIMLSGGSILYMKLTAKAY